ncbi:gas1-like protein [Ophiostoma piceae UAMH 11346]|uniref:Gas1-like protein n=1 Tax=Ophiostoma piceae (strain UAMH 11346) TaxID=1262450 RepID=S3BXF9_OPHP1|nr:gas1-like protein [Ophiostoma piceae UAMH 11346]
MDIVAVVEYIVASRPGHSQSIVLVLFIPDHTLFSSIFLAIFLQPIDSCSIHFSNSLYQHTIDSLHSSSFPLISTSTPSLIMFSKLFILALAASPLVAAHGKVAVIQGDAGGNTTGLGIQGGVVPGAGPNSKTEVDTTVFGSIRAQSDGLGRTTGQGKNKVAMVSQAMALSGTTLPQVSATDGQLTGTYHIVTSDGAGPLKAVLDTTGTGDFSQGTTMDVTTQVPGVAGNIAPDSLSLKSIANVFTRALSSIGLTKRAALNINKDFPVAIAVPAGTTCTGTVGTQQNVCLAKIANSNPAGPFGGVVAFQMVSNGTATARRAVVFSG